MSQGYAAPIRTIRRRWLAALAGAALAAAVLAPVATSQAQEAVGGPVVLMGLDSEQGAGGTGHGPPADHAAMVQSILDATANGGEGILVIGQETGRLATYWNSDIGANLGVDVTFVSGEQDIKDQSFDGFAMIAVASSFDQVTGGLSDADNEALITRDVDIADFVNSGGGLLGKTQDGMSDPFGYVGPLGTFVPMTGDDGLAQYSSVEVTPEGEALGLTQDMSGCCYHDVFLEFPDFMGVLVVNTTSGSAGEGEAAAVGGLEVLIPTGIELEPQSATLKVGETHVLHAMVEEDDAPAEDREVTFTATDGPHEGELGTATTDDQGVATLEYDGAEVGTDTVEASFVDQFERERTSNAVTAEWAEAEVDDEDDEDDVDDVEPVEVEAEAAEAVEAEPTFTG